MLARLCAYPRCVHTPKASSVRAAMQVRTAHDADSQKGTHRLPSFLVNHGGGPLPLLRAQNHASLTRWLESFTSQLEDTPKAILLVSGHYEEETPTISSAPEHKLLFDYNNFPPEAYKYTYPAKGDPELADRTLKLLREKGFSPKTTSIRGLDHGAFVPLMLMYPNADVPIVQLSLLASMDAKAHIEMGRALEPLRDEGVLIVGSGMTFHNMAAFRNPALGDTASKEFDAFLQDALTNKKHSPEERQRLMEQWSQLPSARASHPREEHLLPLFVAYGAGGMHTKASIVWEDVLLGAKVSSFRFD